MIFLCCQEPQRGGGEKANHWAILIMTSTQAASTSESDSNVGDTTDVVHIRRAKAKLLQEREKFAFEQYVTHTIYREDTIDRVGRWTASHDVAEMAESNYAVIYQRILRENRKKAALQASSSHLTSGSESVSATHTK